MVLIAPNLPTSCKAIPSRSYLITIRGKKKLSVVNNRKRERERGKYVNHTKAEVISAFVFFFYPLEKKLPGLPFLFHHPSLFLSSVLFVIPFCRTRQRRHRAINSPRTKRTKFKKVPASMFRVTRATDKH